MVILFFALCVTALQRWNFLNKLKMILQIDSSSIQAIVQNITALGVSMLPANYGFLFPVITSTITAVTALIIRAVEKGKLKREHKQQTQEIVKAYLLKDKHALDRKISEILNRNK